jgi:hypothetical protein
MRPKIYSVIYLSILIFYILRPVLPYIEYSILKDYIVKNLCINRDKAENTCDGKCFLDDQLKKSADPVDADKDNSKKTLPRTNVEDHLKTDEVVTTPFRKYLTLTSFFIPGILDSWSSLVFVPPKSMIF